MKRPSPPVPCQTLSIPSNTAPTLLRTISSEISMTRSMIICRINSSSSSDVPELRLRPSTALRVTPNATLPQNRGWLGILRSYSLETVGARPYQITDRPSLIPILATSLLPPAMPPRLQTVTGSRPCDVVSTSAQR